MKFIEEIKIQFNSFIKDDFFDKNLIIKKLSIENFYVEIEGSYASYSLNVDSSKKIINDNNINEIKNFIDRVNPKDFYNISKYLLYYDFIVEKFIDELKNRKDENSKKLIPKYIYKSSKYSYQKLLEDSEYLSDLEKEKLKDSIFNNLQQKCKYAAHILNDRLPDYEKKLLSFDLEIESEYDEVAFYLRNVLSFLINSHHDDQDRIKHFEKFYRESELYRKLVSYFIEKNRFSFLKLNIACDILDDLAIKNTNMLSYYLEKTYLEWGNSDFYSDQLKKFIKKINQNPKAIYIYYQLEKQKFKLPENKSARKKLMSDPELFASFIINHYNNLGSIELEKLFPEYKKVISKIKDLSLIKNFFNQLKIKFIKKSDVDFNEDKKILKTIKEYYYSNYPELIKKISKSPLYSFYFAYETGAPFEEGEKAIFSNVEAKFSYLSFLQTLGPELVPNYDSYDFSELDEEEEDEEEINF